jgi:hypothetical protein
MRRIYLGLGLLFLAVMFLPAQTQRSAGFGGRLPWCARAFPPQEIKGEMVYPVANGVTAPVLLKQTRVIVPPAKAKLRGVAIVCGIVSVNGRIHTAFMDRAIGDGLDEIAMDTVRHWTFRPSMKDGKPVAAPVSLEIKFGD